MEEFGLFLWLGELGKENFFLKKVIFLKKLRANDVANSFATSVGSKTLTLRQALIVAAIFEFSGAFFVGSHVADTIRKGIVDVTLYQNDPTILMIGMFSALIGGSLWLWIATFIKVKKKRKNYSTIFSFFSN